MKFCPSCGSPLEPATPPRCTACGWQSEPVEKPVAEAPVTPASGTPEAPAAVTPPATEDVQPVGVTGRTGVAIPWGKLAAIVLAVAGLSVVAVVAMRFIFPPGGASSPEEAAEQLAAAVIDQDPIAALRMLNPGEVGSLDDVISGTTDRLKKASLSDDRLVDAVAVSLSGVSYEVSEIDDNAARVYLSGDVDVSYDPAKLPKHMRDQKSTKTWSHSYPIEELIERSNFDTQAFVTVVKDDGRWYVSPLATVAEHMADMTDVAGGDFSRFGEEIEGDRGTDRAEDALEALLTATESGNADDLLSVLPKDQARVVAAYTDMIGQWRERETLGYGVTASRLRATSEEDGDEAVVTVKDASLYLSGFAEGHYESSEVNIANRCVMAGGDEVCLRGTFSKLTGIDDVYVVAKKEGDGWLVDPIATVASYAEHILKSTSDDVILRVLDLPALMTPSAELKVGGSTTVELGDSGMTVVTVPAKKGEIVIVTGDDEDLRYEVFGGAKSIDWYWGGNLVHAPERDGDVRIGVRRWELGTAKVKLDTKVVKPKSGDIPESVKAGTAYQFSAKGEYAFPDTRFRMYKVDDNGMHDVDSNELNGEYVLVALEDGEGLKEYSVGFENGSRTYRGSLDSYSSEDILFTAIAGQGIGISADPDSDLDIALGIDDSNSTDLGLSGEDEYLYFVPGWTGEFTLTVWSFGSGGSYTLTMD